MSLMSLMSSTYRPCTHSMADRIWEYSRRLVSSRWAGYP